MVLENEQEKRTRKRRDGSTDWDKHGEDKNGTNDRLLSSRDDISRNGRHKDESIKDQHQDDKWRDKQSIRDLTSSRSDDKHYRDGKDAEQIWKKKSKPRDREHDIDRDYEHDRDRESNDNRDRDHDYGRDRYREHDREPRRYGDRDREHDCDHEYNHDIRRDQDRDVRESRRNRVREHNHERDCESHRDRERDLGNNRRRDRHGNRDLERYRDHDPDGYRDHDRGHDRHRSMSHADQNCGYKDSRGKKRSLNDLDDCNDMKSRCAKVDHSDMEKRSLNSGKLDSDTDKGRSQFLQSHVDNSMTNKNQNYHEGDDDKDAQRHLNSKYVDSATELRPGTGFARGFVSGAPDRASKCRPLEKIDDNLLGELSIEKPSSAKASPMGQIERSPSSIDHRGTNRTGSWQNLDVDGRARRNGGQYDVRDSIKTLANESALVEPFVNRPNQYNFSSSRSGIDSPARCLMEEDSRNTSSTPYRRTSDSNMERGHVNPWKGVSNWSPTIPNSFIPFQHGPPPGGFQGLVPHFSLCVRPSLDANHPGIPYHFPDADRFPSNVGSLGWQNIVDSSGIGQSHMHGWDGHNVVFQGEPRMYAVPGWDHKIHSVDERVWETNADMNSDLNLDFLSSSKNDDYPVKSPTKEVLALSAEQQPGNEIINHGVCKSVEIGRSSCSSHGKEAPMSQPKSSHEKASQVSKTPGGNNSLSFAAYLSKLDISSVLAQPELYSCCMRLLDLDPSATVKGDFTKTIDGNCGGGIVTKAPDPDSSYSLFPTGKNSVFERALDLYKKQKLENSSFKKGSVDLSAASGREKVEEHIPMPVLDQAKVDELVLTCGQEISKDIVDTPAYKVKDNSNLPSMSCEENPEPQIFDAEKPEQRTPEQEDKDGVRDHILSLENPDDLPSICHPGPKGCDLGDGLSRENISSYSSCFVGDQPQESVALGDPLAGSNDESELVSLSRIHHSPESTH